MPNANDPTSRSLVEVMEDERYVRLKDVSYDELFELALIGQRVLNPAHKELVYLPIAEFREVGYLQEVNRKVLHSAGLALEAWVEDDGPFEGVEYLGGIWDHRDDPEGIFFSPDQLDLSRKTAVEAEQARHLKVRRDTGYASVDVEGVQIIPVPKESTHG